jgi:hypothetical protein
MKLLVGNGHTLTVYDLGEPIMRLRAVGAPIKLHGYHLLEEDRARERLREVLAAGNCEREDG